VVGDLAAAVDLHHRDAGLVQQMFGLACLALCVGGRCCTSQISSTVSAVRSVVNFCMARQVGS